MAMHKNTRKEDWNNSTNLNYPLLYVQRWIPFNAWYSTVIDGKKDADAIGSFKVETNNKLYDIIKLYIQHPRGDFYGEEFCFHLSCLDELLTSNCFPNIFDLSISEKEKDFVKYGFNADLSISVDILEEFSNFPYIGSLVKLGLFGNKYAEYRFIKKASKFLKKDIEIPLDKKKQFLSNLKSKDRKRIYDYIMEYLLRAEDDEKAELMGFVYEECVYGRIDNMMLLRLCSVIDRAFLYDLLELPKYMEENSDDSDAAYNFINLGLIDNYVGGVWKDMPSFQLNNLGHRLYDILNRNNWFDNHLSI